MTKKVYLVFYEDEWYMGKSTIEFVGAFSTEKAAESWLENKNPNAWFSVEEVELDVVEGKFADQAVEGHSQTA
jgi:hypothetical protein